MKNSNIRNSFTHCHRYKKMGSPYNRHCPKLFKNDADERIHLFGLFIERIFGPEFYEYYMEHEPSEKLIKNIKSNGSDANFIKSFCDEFNIPYITDTDLCKARPENIIPYGDSNKVCIIFASNGNSMGHVTVLVKDEYNIYRYVDFCSSGNFYNKKVERFLKSNPQVKRFMVKLQKSGTATCALWACWIAIMYLKGCYINDLIKLIAFKDGRGERDTYVIDYMDSLCTFIGLGSWVTYKTICTKIY